MISSSWKFAMTPDPSLARISSRICSTLGAFPEPSVRWRGTRKSRMRRPSWYLTVRNARFRPNIPIVLWSALLATKLTAGLRLDNIVWKTLSKRLSCWIWKFYLTLYCGKDRIQSIYGCNKIPPFLPDINFITEVMIKIIAKVLHGSLPWNFHKIQRYLSTIYDIPWSKVSTHSLSWVKCNVVLSSEFSHIIIDNCSPHTVGFNNTTSSAKRNPP